MKSWVAKGGTGNTEKFKNGCADEVIGKNLQSDSTNNFALQIMNARLKMYSRRKYNTSLFVLLVMF